MGDTVKSTEAVIADDTQFTSPIGSMEVRLLRPGLLWTRVVGTADGPMALWYRQRLAHARGSAETFVIFDDWEHLERYDQQAKQILLEWTTSNRDVTFHVLTRSRLVAMAMSVVSLTSKARIHAYEDRSRFQRALADADGQRHGHSGTVTQR
jgi:hypothetical protein